MGDHGGAEVDRVVEVVIGVVVVTGDCVVAGERGRLEERLAVED
jgi:hypothetical protein